MSDTPDGIHAPERKFGNTSEKDRLREKLAQEEVMRMDENIYQVRLRRARQGYAFILKYIGAWYIVLSIFKGLFFTFTPSFDLIGLFLFCMGFGLERMNIKHLEEEKADEERKREEQGS